MSALNLRLPDSVHRHINGRAYQQWAELDNINEMTLCTIKAIINQK